MLFDSERSRGLLLYMKWQWVYKGRAPVLRLQVNRTTGLAAFCLA
jgi:hypothetical protein